MTFMSIRTQSFSPLNDDVLHEFSKFCTQYIATTSYIYDNNNDNNKQIKLIECRVVVSTFHQNCY